VEVLSLREADDEEIAHGHVHGMGDWFDEDEYDEN
jgi:FKBP-type peptidyl-prolyl cis-trans isomerase 2